MPCNRAVLGAALLSIVFTVQNGTREIRPLLFNLGTLCGNETVRKACISRDYERVFDVVHSCFFDIIYFLIGLIGFELSPNMKKKLAMFAKMGRQERAGPVDIEMGTVVPHTATLTEAAEVAKLPTAPPPPLTPVLPEPPDYSTYGRSHRPTISAPITRADLLVLPDPEINDDYAVPRGDPRAIARVRQEYGNLSNFEVSRSVASAGALL
ncbi:VP12 [Tarumizu tick virus]|uniref:VP12 n=1 Tax=Tarumizu tick virus TaxID=2014339 RepID=A0A292FWX4_9REOV|nr:VP12 [Tarumizu tick virus]BBA54734.1 VP12 [Tarumizu tick virus]BBA54747.1 VP12 [Tarumizu tick virus]